jgi:hypothetical protein
MIDVETAAPRRSSRQPLQHATDLRCRPLAASAGGRNGAPRERSGETPKARHARCAHLRSLSRACLWGRSGDCDLRADHGDGGNRARTWTSAGDLRGCHGLLSLPRSRPPILPLSLATKYRASVAERRSCAPPLGRESLCLNHPIACSHHFRKTFSRRSSLILSR